MASRRLLRSIGRRKYSDAHCTQCTSMHPYSTALRSSFTNMGLTKPKMLFNPISTQRTLTHIVHKFEQPHQKFSTLKLKMFNEIF